MNTSSYPISHLLIDLFFLTYFFCTVFSSFVQMQQRGQPPQEIIDELAPGMAFGPDGLPTGIPGGGGNGNDGPMDPSECSIQ